MVMSGMLLATRGASGIHAQESTQRIPLAEIVVTGTYIRGTEVAVFRTIGISDVEIGSEIEEK